MSRCRIIEAVAKPDRAALRSLFSGHRVWLASTSPRRRAILRACGVAHRTIKPGVTEPAPHGPNWRRWARTWALRKAQSVSGGVSSGLVIGADTIVVWRQRGLGKPSSPAEAAAMLRALSGSVHRVISGVAVIDPAVGCRATSSSVSLVRFRRLRAREIAAYVRSGEPMDKAGAYAIQEGAASFVERVDGPLDNVIGLPVGALVHALRRVLR